MKKFLLTGTMLLVALTIGAQIKVAPKMKKGDKKVYVAERTTQVGKLQAKMTIETLFEVKDVTADGYVINSLVTDTKVETDTTDMVGRILALTYMMTKDMSTTYVTDKNGQIVGIQDIEKTKKQAEEMIGKLMESIQLPPMVSKDIIKNSAMGNITEMAKELARNEELKSMQMNNSPFALNGKTISTGTEDETSTKEGIKMKRTYTVNSDKSIQTSSKMDMSQDDIVEMILNMASKMFPGEKETVKQQVSQMVKSGMLKLSASDNATYTLRPDGWVDSITSETVTESMGQKTTVTSKIKLKK